MDGAGEGGGDIRIVPFLESVRVRIKSIRKSGLRGSICRHVDVTGHRVII